MALTIIINFLIFNFKFNSHNDILKKKFTLLAEKNGKTLFEKEFKNLKVGDIIKLYEGDICPTNILIITNQHKINRKDVGFVENFLIDEKIRVVKKKGLNKFKPKYPIINSIDFRKLYNHLSFTLEYNDLNDFNNFRALLKIRKDPKPENVTIDNIIKKDSIIRSKWILGIILNLDNDFTKDYLIKLDKKTKFEKMIDNFFLQLILIAIFLQFFFFIFIADVNWFELKHYYNFLFTLFIFMPPQVKNLISFCELIKTYKINKSFIKKDELFFYPRNIMKKIQLSCTSEFSCTPRNLQFKKKKRSSFLNDKKLFKGSSQIIKRKSVFNKDISIVMNEFKNNYKKNMMKIINPKVLTEIVDIDSVVFSKLDYISQKLLKVKTISTLNCYYNIKYLKEDAEDNSEQEINFCVMKKKKKRRGKSNKKIKTMKEMKNRIIKNNFLKKVQKEEEKAEEKEIKLNLIANLRRNGRMVSISDLQNIKNIKKNEFIYENKILKLNELHNNEFILDSNKGLKDLLINIVQITDYAMINKNRDVFETLSYLDKSLNDFYSFFNYSIIDLESLNSISGFEVQLKQDNFYYVTKILHIDTFLNNSTLKIYILDIETRIISIYIRTNSFTTLKRYLKDFEKNIIIKNIYHKNKEKNLKTIVFLKTELNIVESTNLLIEYEKLIKKQINPDNYLENYFDTNIEFMKFYGAIGIREYVNKNLTFFQDLKKANITLGYLTNDKIENPATVLKRLNLDFKNSTQINLNFKSVEEGKIKIRNIFMKHEDIFKSISDDFKNLNQKKIIYLTKKNIFYKKLLCLNFSGQALSLIKGDPYLFYNFKFFIKYSNSFVGHNLKNSQKKFIIEILQDLEKKKIF